MPCSSCKTTTASRPAAFELETRAKICADCRGHTWVRLPDNSIACRACRVIKRDRGQNLPCAGKPPWVELAKN